MKLSTFFKMLFCTLIFLAWESDIVSAQNQHIIGSDNNGSTAALKITSGTQDMLLDGNEIDAKNAKLYLNHNSTGGIAMATNGGNVGIGTTSPSTKLHIIGADNNGSTATLRITSGTQHMLLDGNEIDAQNAKLYLNHNSTGGIAMATSGGNVTIGSVTTPVGYKLYVDEGILTEKVKVAVPGTPQWADYVFEEDYDLNSVEEVEDFIKENKHLPNVPSAKEVVDDGIDLAKMDATLLRQVEELWLHVIEMKKENEMLKQEIHTLKESQK